MRTRRKVFFAIAMHKRSLPKPETGFSPGTDINRPSVVEYRFTTSYQPVSSSLVQRLQYLGPVH